MRLAPRLGSIHQCGAGPDQWLLVGALSRRFTVYTIFVGASTTGAGLRQGQYCLRASGSRSRGVGVGQGQRGRRARGQQQHRVNGLHHRIARGDVGPNDGGRVACTRGGHQLAVCTYSDGLEGKGGIVGWWVQEFPVERARAGGRWPRPWPLAPGPPPSQFPSLA